jgi:FdhD protein
LAQRPHDKLTGSSRHDILPDRFSDSATMTGSSQTIEISKVDGSGISGTTDKIAVEEPLEIQLTSSNAEGSAARSVSITMRTPGDDFELALGFLFTEGIIRSGDQVISARHCGEVDTATGLRNIVRIEVDPGVDLQLDRLQRHFYTTSSCGVCGKASLDALRVTGQSSLAAHKTSFMAQTLIDMPGIVRRQQPVFNKTGGLHAAAIFGSDGEIAIVKEDVGRHNATDKAIGALFSAGRLPAHHLALLVSGRASFELVQKALVAGIPLLAAVGAPSSLAVQTAKEFNMTLVGFLRDGTFNIYAGPERISHGAS